MTIDAGIFRFGEITIPAGVTLVGAGKATIIRRPRESKRVFVQEGVSDWRLRDVTLNGETPMADPSRRTDAGEYGLIASRCTGFEISGVTVNNFNGVGIQLSHTAPSPYCHWATASHIFNVSTGGNYVGMKFDTRSEYINVSMLTSQGNFYGCIIHGGNVKIANSNFTHNNIGMLIEDHENGSHGAISNCLINHNISAALKANRVGYGMTIDNCCFFTGGIEVRDSQGVSITDSIVSCGVEFSGNKANMFSNNYIVLSDGEKHTFAPSTILKDNYTDKGPLDGTVDV